MEISSSHLECGRGEGGIPSHDWQSAWTGEISGITTVNVGILSETAITVLPLECLLTLQDP